jgi:hypothetical protein
MEVFLSRAEAVDDVADEPIEALIILTMWWNSAPYNTLLNASRVLWKHERERENAATSSKH